MKVIVSSINATTKTAIVTIGDKAITTKLTLPSNKGAENDAWVDMRTTDIKQALGTGDHKNWLTVPRNTTDSIECETEKKPKLPNFISILNLQYYVTKEEYETCKGIFDKATAKLNEMKKGV